MRKRWLTSLALSLGMLVRGQSPDRGGARPMPMGPPPGESSNPMYVLEQGDSPPSAPGVQREFIPAPRTMPLAPATPLAPTIPMAPTMPMAPAEPGTPPG